MRPIFGCVRGGKIHSDVDNPISWAIVTICIKNRKKEKANWPLEFPFLCLLIGVMSHGLNCFVSQYLLHYDGLSSSELWAPVDPSSLMTVLIWTVSPSRSFLSKWLLLWCWVIATRNITCVNCFSGNAPDGHPSVGPVIPNLVISWLPSFSFYPPVSWTFITRSFILDAPGWTRPLCKCSMAILWSG